MPNIGFEPTFKYTLIYIFRINDDQHRGYLKIGETTMEESVAPFDELKPNSSFLNQAAKKRINEYTKTAAIQYELLHTELAIFIDNNKHLKAFGDHKVHKVLERSGYNPASFRYLDRPSEWYKTDLQTAINAIQAAREGRISLNQSEKSLNQSPIEFRPEQIMAIEQTIRQFKLDKNSSMLWNAKMRFGKTLTALEIVKKMHFKKTIILTHRPVVNEGWFDDFNKIFYKKNSEYKFGSKTRGSVDKKNIKDTDYVVYFASIQDLRGSSEVGGSFDKNNELFQTNWDFVVIDEAHEGTLTKLGESVINHIVANDSDGTTRILRLSGTPFNILDQYKRDDVFTWDYVMEQKAKTEWPEIHGEAYNPYYDLPQMKIYTYSMKNIVDEQYIDIEDNAFNFKEFFRVWTDDKVKDKRIMPTNMQVGEFVHRDEVVSFLDRLAAIDENSNYPYSKKEYRRYFRHSLWMVPGVKEAKSLKNLMEKHPVFGSGQFRIVNVAGNDEQEESRDALKNVQEAINDDRYDYSITLSCGKLTTGVTVPEWTAVFMLAGSASTSASSYLQTIFRVQSPGNIDGMVKEACYVFDFAPDRTLKMIAEAGRLRTKIGAVGNNSLMGEFLNFCPVISISGSSMKPYSVDSMLQEIKKANADRVAKNGFDDRHLYNDNLLKLDEVDLSEFEELKKIIGSAKQTKQPNDVHINDTGLTNEEYEKLSNIENKPKKERTQEELNLLAEKKQKKENAQKAMLILRGISIRIPLLIYGADIPINEDVTVDNFTDIIDDLSWNEFMPAGVTKEKYKKFSKYYEQDVFIAAGRQIRNMTLSADELEPTERVKKISSIFATFKNPDKETVLTPWRVVNMHMGTCLGGYDFYDESHEKKIEEPRYVNHGQVTIDVFNNPKAKILDINSKTGLYPLYVTYSIYRNKLKQCPKDQITNELEQKLWRETVENNIFVICKTPMAKSITKRTLVGYNDNIHVNAHAFDDLINQIKNKPEMLTKNIQTPKFWNKKDNEEMKFNAVVGNPPYQETINKTEKQTQSNAIWIYQYFQFIADKLGDYVCLIYPFGGWFDSPKRLNGLGNVILRDGHTISIHAYEGTNDKRAWYRNDKTPSPIFKSNANLSAGISIVLRGKNKCNSFKYSNRIYTDEIVDIDIDGIELLTPNPLFIKINKKLGKNKIINQIKKGIFGIESDYVEKNPEKVSFNEHDWARPIRLLTNDKSGSSGRAKYYWTDRKHITKGEKYFDYYKIVISSAYPKKTLISSDPTIGNVKKRINKLIEFLPANSAFGRSRMALFMSKNKQECNNFIKYMNTNFFSSLTLQEPNRCSTFGSIIPNQDFSSQSDVDWNKPIETINEQLYKKYKLSEEEIAFIEQTITSME